MEKTEKFFVTDEFLAESLVEEYKQNQEGMLIDHKVSLKETKETTYYIVTLKTRYTTLSEAKESI
jgi:hypothetical protein